MSTDYYKNIAHDYDNMLKGHKWQAPELIFNYLSDHVQAQSKLLDIGVGTGISSQRFHKMQVELYGLDRSSDMLAVCEAKNLFTEVLLFDILKDEIPYPEATFEYVVCSGVLHFFSNLEDIFAKISSVLKNSGFFAFTFIENDKDYHPYLTLTINGTHLYHHSKDYINSLVAQFKFMTLQDETFTTIKDLTTKETLDHTLIVLKKK
ncbi:MAG: class I SAM-dependent methyltransferase [Bacteroidota bacterium]